jgi:hypothetical protein
MATDVQAPDAAIVERERVVRAIREHEAELRTLCVTGSGCSALWRAAIRVAGATSTC